MVANTQPHGLYFWMIWGRSSVGRAAGSQSAGRGFDSLRLQWEAPCGSTGIPGLPAGASSCQGPQAGFFSHTVIQSEIRNPQSALARYNPAVADNDQRASKQFRITRRSDIDRVFTHGKRANDGVLTLIVLPNALNFSRLGVAVSMRHGKAVRRNRVKRLCREAFRLIRSQLPSGYDYMILPRAGATLTLVSIQSSIRILASRLIRQTGVKDASP